MAISTDTPDEVWRAIPGYDGYEASTLGRIRSLDRYLTFDGRWGPTTRFHRGRVLKIKIKPTGTGFYRCFYAGRGSYPQVNRVICEVFNGPPPSQRHEAAHLNGNSLDDHYQNLVWATPVENASHKVAHDTVSIGSRNGAARLCENDIPGIFSAYVAGVNAKTISERFGVSEAAVLTALRRETWKHVSVDPAIIENAQKVASRNIVLARERANLERSRQALARGSLRAKAFAYG